MKRNRFTAFETITCLFSVVALAVSGLTLYLQFNKSDRIILRVNPVTYDGFDRLKEKFEFTAVNLGNTSGMVNIQSITVGLPGSETKSKYIPINKTMIIKPGEMETIPLTLDHDLFESVSSDDKKHKLYVGISYLDSHGNSKSGKYNAGFISMSGSKKTIYSERGYLKLSKLPHDKGGYFAIKDDKYVTYGNPETGFERVQYKIVDPSKAE